jgi:hypothetical protein
MEPTGCFHRFLRGLNKYLRPYAVPAERTGTWPRGLRGGKDELGGGPAVVKDSLADARLVRDMRGVEMCFSSAIASSGRCLDLSDYDGSDIVAHVQLLLVSKRLKAAKSFADRMFSLASISDAQTLMAISDIYRVTGNRNRSLELSKALVKRFPRCKHGYLRAVEDSVALGRKRRVKNISAVFKKRFPISNLLWSLRTDLSQAFLKNLSHKPFLDAWHLSLCWTDPQGRGLPVQYQQPDYHRRFAIRLLPPIRLGIQPIQYWSQSEIPEDVSRLTHEWNAVLSDCGLPPVALFTKSAAAEWIAANAPEFLISFQTAFNYAVESDVFRVAYASRCTCLYIDADMKPYPWSSRILRSVLREVGSVLYLRRCRPMLGSCFFLARKGCPFFESLANSCREVDFGRLDKSKQTVYTTFGVDKFMSVLLCLLDEYPFRQVDSIGLGLVRIKWRDFSVSFVNESSIALASQFGLAYKATTDNWHNVV